MPTPATDFSLSGLLRRTIGDRLAPNANGFLEMCADDIVWEFPFAPAGGIDRLEGKAAVTAYLPKVGVLFTLSGGRLTATHRTRDADVAILEFEVTGTGNATGLPYDQRYIVVVTTRHGRIVHFKDYWNPLTLLSAVGGEDALAAALKDA